MLLCSQLGQAGQVAQPGQARLASQPSRPGSRPGSQAGQAAGQLARQAVGQPANLNFDA